MMRLFRHQNSLLPLTLALCLLFAGPAAAQSVLTKAQMDGGPVPLELPFFEDTTQTGSVQQAAIQFQRFGTARDIFNVTHPLVIQGKGEMLWLQLNVTNTTADEDFYLTFAPQDKHGTHAIKSIRLIDPQQPGVPLSLWPGEHDTAQPLLTLHLPANILSTRYIQIETWPALHATLLPVLKSAHFHYAEEAQTNRILHLAWIIIGFICGIIPRVGQKA